MKSHHGIYGDLSSSDAPNATKEYDKSIHTNPDTAAWASFFKKTCDSLGKECK